MINTNLLKAKIVELGYTQLEVAKQMGISYQSFNYKLNSINEFKVSEIEKLCKVLKINKSEAHLYFLS